ncbi:MAG TPA: PP2C family serine/threonine-protein phosphatase [Ornithinibacter sp.]|nr:PP2C family serine/threonine-protein phosphatase [Ornithinibacter sp.]
MTPSEEAGTAARCPSCQSQVAAGERFCEGCGADLGLPPAADPPPVAAASSAAAAPAAPEVAARPSACRECGGEVADDGYCTQCGTRAPLPRNHFSEQPAPWVAAVCDRGVRHHSNEDAVAVAAGPASDGHAVLVVCDGVSSSTDSDVASLAAARAARDVLTSAGPLGAGTVATKVAAGAKALVLAVDAANEAVIAHTTAGPGNPASCTFVAAVVDLPELVVGWVGDSRAYWLPDAGSPRLLTTDDSFAAEQIAHGVPRATAETGPHAHAITRWLGVDAPDHTPRTASLELDGPGWVLVCSDGLWNYCSEATDLAALVVDTGRATGTEPLALAGALVDWANARGGQDNITVALARVSPDQLHTTAPPD